MSVNKNNAVSVFENPSVLNDLAVERAGRKIILPNDPENMTARQAITRLEKLEQDEETIVAVDHTLEGIHYHDGLIALSKAMRDIYGWVESLPTPTFFGPIPPKVISITTGVGKKVRVVEGRMSLPNIPDEECYIQPYASRDGGFITFRLVGQVRKKYEHFIAAIVDRTIQFANEESIYKGQAIRMECDDDGDLDANPKFMDISRIESPIFSKLVEQDIATNIYTPIRFTDRVRSLGVPIKRGVLLEGPYGTGKTLVSYTTAQECVRNGWTFIAVNHAVGLRQTLEFARRYMPAVVFCEDIDRAAGGEKRTLELDDILNTIDGLESKSTEIMVVLTSNHVKNISKPMLRPGRLDAVIRIEAPDAEAVQRLLRVYGRGLIKETENLDNIGAVLAGRIPAIIREVVERSKLYALMIAEGKGELAIVEDALIVAAHNMSYHWGLLDEDKDTRSSADKLMDALGEALGERLNLGEGGGTGLKLLQALSGVVEGIDDTVDTINGGVQKVREQMSGAAAGSKDQTKLALDTNKKVSRIADRVG